MPLKTTENRARNYGMIHGRDFRDALTAMPDRESAGRVTESGQTDPQLKDCPCTCTSCMLPSISCVLPSSKTCRSGQAASMHMWPSTSNFRPCRHKRIGLALRLLQPTTTSYRPTATMVKSHSTIDKLVSPPVPLVATDGRFVFDRKVELRIETVFGTSETIFEIKDTAGIKYFDVRETFSLKGGKRTLVDIDGVPILNIRKSTGGYTVASGAKAEPVLFEIAAATKKHIQMWLAVVDPATGHKTELCVEGEVKGGGIYLGSEATEGAAIANIRIDKGAYKNKIGGLQIDIVVMPGVDVALVGLLLVAFDLETTKKSRPLWKMAMFMP
ncbi:hypothetical protein BC831DRAFT_162838 [Entophlyctis helioformis]|nr:hypothetical protein BC831DRAFT_162838 [Entophlyctis helioformis]